MRGVCWRKVELRSDGIGRDEVRSDAIRLESLMDAK